MQRKLLLALAYIFFNRTRSLIACAIFALLSLVIELRFLVHGLFACSGAVVTLAGLYLNIKHSLNFHLKITKIGLYNKLAGAGLFGTTSISPEQEAWMNGVLVDEMFGVTFMIVGTLLWAYGGYLVDAIR